MPDEPQKCDKCECESEALFAVFDTLSGWRGGRGCSSIACEDCRESYYFYCNGYDEYYLKSNVEEVYVGGGSYSYDYANRNFHYWESDDEWHTEEEPEDEEPEVDPDGNDIPGYHSTPREFHAKIGAAVYGVELEVQANSEERGHWWDLARNRGLIIEEDGSLNDRLGMEIVGKPYPMSSYMKTGCPWKWALETIDAKGWDADGNYGMHVSANRSMMSDETLAKVIVFVNHNSDFSQRVAGRKQNTYCQYKEKRRGSEIVDSRDHYGAIAVAKNRVEFRIFRSNMKPDGFMKNIEFVDAVIRFCADAKFDDLTPDKFMEFVRDCPTCVNLRTYLPDLVPSPAYRAEVNQSRFPPHDPVVAWNGLIHEAGGRSPFGNIRHIQRIEEDDHLDGFPGNDTAQSYMTQAMRAS